MAAGPEWHDRAAVISTGDELVLGESADTNARDLAERLWGLGIEVIEHVTLGDDRGATRDALLRLGAAAPLVITTGGLGPTADDLVREALADALGEGLVVDEGALRALEARFAARGRPMTDAQRRQAMRPESARCLENPHGTAPAIYAVLGAGARGGGADVFCLPGPPREWMPLFDRLVAPMLRVRPGRAVATRLVHAVGIGEGDAAARLGAMLERGRLPRVGITVAGGVVTLRVRCVVESAEEGRGRPSAAALVEADERAIRAGLGVHVFGTGEETPAGSVVRRLAARGRRLAVVESCTGGLLGGAITAVAGSSAVFVGGWITYSNAMKAAAVGVTRATLEARGAVSAEAAAEMARGGLERMAVDEACAGGRPVAGRHCVAVTGIAGPEGGTAAKPVGTVFVAHAWAEGGGGSPAAGVDVRRFLIGGVREDVRQRSVTTALAMLHLWLEQGEGCAATPLLWQVAAG
jgi:nicotinamide-nucleotide amidase